MRLEVAKISFVVFLLLIPFSLVAGDKNFHDAPDAAKAQKNPLQGQAAAIDEGKTAYARNCLSCHGKTGQGTGNVPSLVGGKLKDVAPGEIFWFITKGSKDNGMPSWAFLPEEKRWQIVSYVDALAAGKATGVGSVGGGSSSAYSADASFSGAAMKAPPPKAPFTDFRF